MFTAAGNQHVCCVAGITLSPQQVARGTSLAAERGLSNASFQVMDAQAMTFADNSFDLVWACESGEHMPDKQKYIQEMERVLKPGEGSSDRPSCACSFSSTLFVLSRAGTWAYVA